MENLIFRVLVASVGLYFIDLLIIGFALGFGAFLAFCVAIWLLFWSYHRLVASRQVKPVQNWRWQQFGNNVYRMEVA